MTALTLLSLWLWTPDLPRATLEARYLAAAADLSTATSAALVWGKADAMIPVSNARDDLQAITGSRWVSWPQVGHLPQEEAAELSLQAVVDFLR